MDRRGACATLTALILVASGLTAPAATSGDTASRRQSRAPDASLAFTFAASAYSLRTLDPTLWPYYTTTVVPISDPGVHDEFGVRMVKIGGVLYDHPVAQAQYAIALIYSYLGSGDPAYLARAEAQAQRLMDRAVSSRGAIYFPYPFNFARHGVASDTMVAPWYSAMAQGQALTVFVRLYEITANEAYRSAADLTYASFTNLRASGVPWTVFVDSGGYVWFEEYPAATPDRTYNGLTFAIYGLWDYHRLTNNPDALLLFRGGLTTVAKYAPSIRAVNWVSRYCLAHGVRSTTYHQIHVNQMLKLHNLTGAVGFARFADAFAADYPYPKISGTVRFAAGTFIGYRFDASGNVTASKTYTLARASSAPFSQRIRIKNRAGSWFLISAGVWAGYYILEVPGRAYAPGALPFPLNYNPQRTVSFSPGTYTGRTFNTGGGVTASKTATLGKTSTAATDQRVIINGTTYLRIVNGIWAGMYVPLTSGMSY